MGSQRVVVCLAVAFMSSAAFAEDPQAFEAQLKTRIVAELNDKLAQSDAQCGFNTLKLEIDWSGLDAIDCSTLPDCASLEGRPDGTANGLKIAETQFTDR